MRVILGIVIVFACVLGGYVMHHGNLAVLWQPTEYLIIVGAAVGSFVIGNPSYVVKAALGSFKKLMVGGHPIKKEAYLELLSFLYTIFKFIKTKGMLEVEAHIENPEGSDIFAKFPGFLHDHHAVDFFCDYVRVMTMGVDNKYVLEDMMVAELEGHHAESHAVAHSIQIMGDAFPAIGIVAAVLGVIITMGSISEPPEILGGLIGAALVGTFLGVLISYCFVQPFASSINNVYAMEGKYLEVIKTGMLAHVSGNAPAISVEFARKIIPSGVRPTFKEVEEAVQKT
jgi:chemotaxis protein MotA